MLTSLPDAARRAVITGIGVVAPNGIGTDPWWSATVAGQSGIGPIRRPEIRPLPAGAASAGERVATTRPVCFDAADGYVDTPVRWRPDLAPGVRVDGPAIIEEFGSTVPVHPGFTATVDAWGNLVVTRSHQQEGGGA